MLDAKLKGAGVDTEEETAEPPASNVVDLMAALKRSLGEQSEQPAGKASAPASSAKSKAAKPPPRREKPRANALPEGQTLSSFN